jgi:hypothetical protein
MLVKGPCMFPALVLRFIVPPRESPIRRPAFFRWWEDNATTMADDRLPSGEGIALAPDTHQRQVVEHMNEEAAGSLIMAYEPSSGEARTALAVIRDWLQAPDARVVLIASDERTGSIRTLARTYGIELDAPAFQAYPFFRIPKLPNSDEDPKVLVVVDEADRLVRLPSTLNEQYRWALARLTVMHATKALLMTAGPPDALVKFLSLAGEHDRFTQRSNRLEASHRIAHHSQRPAMLRSLCLQWRRVGTVVVFAHPQPTGESWASKVLSEGGLRYLVFGPGTLVEHAGRERAQQNEYTIVVVHEDPAWNDAKTRRVIGNSVSLVLLIDDDLSPRPSAAKVERVRKMMRENRNPTENVLVFRASALASFAHWEALKQTGLVLGRPTRGTKRIREPEAGTGGWPGSKRARSVGGKCDERVKNASSHEAQCGREHPPTDGPLVEMDILPPTDTEDCGGTGHGPDQWWLTELIRQFPGPTTTSMEALEFTTTR